MMATNHAQDQDPGTSRVPGGMMHINQENAAKTGVDRDGRARPTRWSWIIPALVSVLIALVFFSNLESPKPTKPTATPDWDGLKSLPDFAAAIRSDMVAVLRSQAKTFGTIGLYALIPGILGTVYRKKFWPWFLGAFAVLFAFNVIFYEAYDMSVSSGLLRGLHYPYWAYVAGEALLLLGLLIFRLRRHTTQQGPNRQRKNIVVCLDGTWNHPGQTDWGYLAQTNVFKLFDSLEESDNRPLVHFNAARCKRFGPGKHEQQVAFYYNGVGNKVENSVIGQTVGGAFGLGAEAIKERAYLDVVREYQPGDRIFIFGFSRGAALARMLASALDKRGVPREVWTLRLFGRQRPVWTSQEHIPVTIAVLGCWDTVGAFGISKDILGIPFQRINLLKDLTVPLCVERAYHLLALDEDRDSFEPTLMDPDPVNPDRVVELWFSGNHSNVGGGFATDGLSDHTLSFMLEHVSSGWNVKSQRTTDDPSWGLFLKPGRTFRPNPLGKLRVSGGSIYERRPRQVPMGATIHDSVFRRIRDENSAYAPDGLFRCNALISMMRDKITSQVQVLKKTKSLNEQEASEVEKWVDERLTIQKWSRLQTRPKPPMELQNG